MVHNIQMYFEHNYFHWYVGQRSNQYKGGITFTSMYINMRSTAYLAAAHAFEIAIFKYNST